MSDISVSVQISGPGEQLKKAREIKNITVEQVADQMHLRASIVAAIDAGEYDQLPGTTFLKGYIRAYARIVDVSESAMIELLDQQLGTQADEEAKERALDKEKTGKRVGLLLSLALIVILLVVVILEWDNLKELVFSSNNALVPEVTVDKADTDNKVSVVPAQVDANKVKAVSIEPEPATVVENTRSIVVNENASAFPQGSEQISVLVPNATEVVTQPNVDDVEVGSVEQPSTERPSIEQPSVEIPNGELSIAIPSTAESSTIEVTNVEVPVVASVKLGSIQIGFTGDCWFKMKNGVGKTVFAALKHNGDLIDYKGELPFSLVVGAADKVSIAYNGSPLDLKQFRIRNNRTAFELN